MGVLQKVLLKIRFKKGTATSLGDPPVFQMKELQVEESKYILYYFLHVLHNYILISIYYKSPYSENMQRAYVRTMLIKLIIFSIPTTKERQKERKEGIKKEKRKALHKASDESFRPLWGVFLKTFPNTGRCFLRGNG